jgi:hypothetical protein
MPSPTCSKLKYFLNSKFPNGWANSTCGLSSAYRPMKMLCFISQGKKSFQSLPIAKNIEKWFFQKKSKKEYLYKD